METNIKRGLGAVIAAIVVTAGAFAIGGDDEGGAAPEATAAPATSDEPTTTVRRTTTTDAPRRTTTTTTTEAPAEEEEVECATWQVTQSDPATTKWLEDGLTPDNVEAAQKELLTAIKSHHDLLGATVLVFADTLRADPETVQWEELADEDGCITDEGRDLYMQVETLLLAQKWVWQIPCRADHVGTGITADGNIVRREEGLGRVANYGCYIFFSVPMGEDPTNPDTKITGVLGSVSKFCGNINPPDKPPHIPPGPTPEPPPEEPPPTTKPPVTTQPPPSSSTVPPTTTCGNKNRIDDNGDCVPNTVEPTVAPPPTTSPRPTTTQAPPTPPTTAPPDTLPPGVTPTTYEPDPTVVPNVPIGGTETTIASETTAPPATAPPDDPVVTGTSTPEPP